MKKLFCFILLNVFSLSALSAFASDIGKVCVKIAPDLGDTVAACALYSGESKSECKIISSGNISFSLHEGDMLRITAFRGGGINLTIGKNLNFGDTVEISRNKLAKFEIKKGTCK